MCVADPLGSAQLFTSLVLTQRDRSVLIKDPDPYKQMRIRNTASHYCVRRESEMISRIPWLVRENVSYTRIRLISLTEFK